MSSPWLTAEDPYVDEATREVRNRAPAGLAFFLGCVALSAAFEIARYPERRAWMLGFAAGFAALSLACRVLIGRFPAAAIGICIGLVNVVGIALNAYHAIVGAPVAMCLWTITGLLCSSAVFLRWSGRAQALASVGALASFPIHLWAGTADPLTWSAGGAYLIVMASMSVFGAVLYAGYQRSGIQLARALSEREARLQSYFDRTPIGTAIIHSDGTFLEVNDALCRVLHEERDALLLARRWFDVAAPNERGTARRRVRTALSGAAMDEPYETRLVRKDGVVIDASVGVRGLPGPRGVLDHVMVLVEDITERKRADAERERALAAELEARRHAEAASRAKDEFLATISHELRTPLSPILAWSDLLRRGAVPPDQTDRGLAAIARNATAQARLIDELLDVSRIVAGKLRLELRPVALAPVVSEAVELVRPSVESKKIAVDAELATPPCVVLGDPDRLRQVVTNLLANAIKFTPSGGRVHVTLARHDGQARLVVADTGRGIPAAFLPYVFERFRQVDTTSTRQHGGLGIGLAIVRELVELHGGRVQAESPGEGRGAIFTVELPLLANQEASAAPRMPAPRAVTLDGVRVLVVDDDPDSNDVVRTLLASHGADVRTAASAPEALDVVRSWTPDLVVSDIAMPKHDGYWLLERMRAEHQALRGVPAIALTAYSAPADREHALAAGFALHLAKPVTGADLLGAVTAIRG